MGNVLKRYGLPPAPEHTTTWKEIIRAHMDVLVTTGFFTTEVWTWGGLVTYYILLFIHLGTREVHVAGFTPHPDQQWMIQIARHVTVADWGFLAPRQYLIHDRDGKCCPAFQHLIDDAAVQRIVLPPQSPNLNAYAERWVRSVKDEVLSRLILFGEPSLRHALSQYIIVSYEESGMPVDFLTEAERERWQRLPDAIPQDDLLVFFLLSDDDRRETQRQRAPQNRLSYALQLCILRYLDFVPDDLQAPSHEAVTFVAEQLEMDRVCSPSRHRRAPVRRRQSQSQPGEMAGPDWLEIDEPALATPSGGPRGCASRPRAWGREKGMGSCGTSPRSLSDRSHGRAGASRPS